MALTSFRPPYDYKVFTLLLVGRTLAITYCVFAAFGHLVSLFSTQFTAVLHPYFPMVTVSAYLILSVLHIRATIRMFRPFKPTLSHYSYLYRTYFDYGCVYGRLGPHYEYILVLRELLEIPAQTYMGYSLSLLSTWAVFPTVYGLIITFNCTVCPLLMLYFRKDTELLDRRNTLMMLDAIIDLVQGALIPMLILLSPVVEFYLGNARIGDLNWTIKFVSVAQHLVVMSPWDFVATILPILMCHFLLNSIHSNLIMIQDCLKHNPEIRMLKKDQSSAIIKKIQEEYWKKRSKNIGIVPEAKATLDVESKNIVQVSSRNVKKFLGLCSLVWGAVVFVLVIKAPSLTACDNVLDGSTCELPIKPWWSPTLKECHCLYVVINCYENSMLQGKNEEETYELVNDNVLSKQIAPEDTMGLLFHACPFIKVPEAINQFTKLRALLITYSPQMKSVSIELESFPQLSTIYISGSALETIPENFRKIPPGLFQMFILQSKLTQLPAWFAEEWSDTVEELGLDGNALQFIPPEIGEFKKLVRLHLENNLILSLPEEIATLPLLRTLYVGGNLLTSIPESFLNLPLKQVNIADNQITAVPWNFSTMLEWNSRKELFLAVNNPLCDQVSDLKQSPVCESTCSPLCDRMRLSDAHCSHACNNAECNFDNGTCLQRPQEQ